MNKKVNLFLIVLLSLLCLEFNTNAQSILFNHTYGSAQYNQGRRIIEAGDRGFYILGNVSANSGNSNIHIIRTDSLGIILFEKNLGEGPVYWANDFIRTSDKGFLIAGLTDKLPDKGYDMLLIKTDSNINVEWEHYYGGADWDIANAVIETKDSAYLIAGLTYSYGAANENIYMVKTNYLGDTIWTKTFGGDSTDYATSVDVRYDSTYLVGATTNSFGFGSYDGYVLNLDLDGDTIWTKNYGEEKEDIIYSIKQTPDSGFVFVGSTMSYNAIQHEHWLMDFDKNLNYQWKIPEFWEIGPGDDVAYSVTINDSAHIILTGFTTNTGNGSKDITLTIMRGQFNFKCSYTAGSLEDDVGYETIQTADKGYAIVGFTEGLGIGLSSIYVIRIGNDCSYTTSIEHILDVEEPQVETGNELFGIYPNISSGKFSITFFKNNVPERFILTITDVFGRMLLSDKIDNQLPYNFDISDVADGIYFITVSDSKNTSYYKIIKCGK
jgi:hypothetical protein